MERQAASLVATVSDADPFRPASLGVGEMAGPLLTALAAGAWRRVLLLLPEDLGENGVACEAAVRGRYPQLDVRTVALGCSRGADCSGWLRALPTAAGAILDGREAGDWVVALGPGAPSLVAAWLVLLAQGPARIPWIEVRPASGPGLPAETVWHDAEGDGERRWRIRETGRAAYRAGSALSLQAALRELGLRGEHPAWVRTLEAVAALAPHKVPVLIQGETGTGKGMLARLIHRMGGRADGPLVSVNCGALPTHLVGSVLFGHCRGAFTGADRDQTGKFEAADGGTLFLDEIGELPLELQPHLLKVLEDGMVEPIGGRVARRVDVRILAATNRDLGEALRRKTFREDLYYRLSYGLIEVPPLRERSDDVPLLADQFLEQINASLMTPKRITPEGLRWLCGQAWEGNVRDLQNMIGRTALLSRSEVLGPDEFAAALPSPRPSDPESWPTPCEGFHVEEYLSEARRRLFDRALAMAGGKAVGAARLLGVTSQAVSRYVRERQGKV